MSFLSRNSAQPVSLKRRIFSLPTLLSFGIAAAFIFFLTTRFDLDWQKTWENVRGMDPWAYLMGFVLYYVSFGFRGIRWQILARNANLLGKPGTRLPSWFELSQLIVIGWFVNSVTWLRLGDPYRAYAFSEDSGREFSWSLGTILAERTVDMVTVLVLVVVGVVSFSATTEFSGLGFILVAAVAMAVGLGALLLAMRRYGVRLARFLPHRLESAYRRFHQGTLGSLRQIPLIFAVGLIGWLLEVGRLYFVVLALDMTITAPLLLVATLGHALLSTVPTPGGVGAVEPGLTGLLVLELERHDALSIALVDRSITYVSIIIIGGLIFLIYQAGRARRRARAPAPAEADPQTSHTVAT